jgi:methionine-gamma-lyase
MATARYHKVKIGEHELNAETLMLGYGYDPSATKPIISGVGAALCHW